MQFKAMHQIWTPQYIVSFMALFRWFRWTSPQPLKIVLKRGSVRILSLWGFFKYAKSSKGRIAWHL